MGIDPGKIERLRPPEGWLRFERKRDFVFSHTEYAQRCADEIAGLEQEILRSIEVAPNSNMEFLKTKIKSDLADEFGIRVNRDPSFGGLKRLL